MEIATRLGDTLLDVAHIDADFELAGVTLVYDGELVAPASGRIGLVDYTATPVEPPVRSIPFTVGNDHRWIPYATAALALHVGLWGLATTTSPPPAPRVASKPAQRPIKIARVAALPAPTKAPVPDDRARDRVEDTKSQGQARAVQGASGAAGAQPSPRLQRGHIAVKNTGEEAQLTKAEAIAQARTAGILGQAQTVIDNYASLHGNDALTSGFDAASSTGSSGDATSGGGFGVGRSGFGGGGGGGTYGTIGTGSTGQYSYGTTHGHGWGGSVAPATTPWTSWAWQDGYYYPGQLPRRRLRAGPTVDICPREGAPACTVDGALDKAIVRRYVRRNVAKLSYCFERALLAQPSLRGDVVATFSINAEGRVDTARAVGLDDEVATCVREVFEQIEFPRGATLVEYVLRFRSSRNEPP